MITKKFSNFEMTEVLGHIVQVKDVLNYDINFLRLEIDIEWLKLATSRSYKFCYIDPENGNSSEEINAKAYRSRLAGILVDPNLDKIKIDHRLKEAKYHLIRWLNITGGIFEIVIINLDKHNRVIVDLYDPVNQLSVSKYLLINFGDIFLSYNYQ